MYYRSSILPEFATPRFPLLPQSSDQAGEAERSAMPKITKRLVDALRPDRSGKDVFVWDAGDGALKGFGIRMKRSGAASYFVQYRNKEGRTRRLVIGKIGTLAPDEARRLAGDALQFAAKGGDPSAKRHAVRGAITVADLCELYLADAKSRIKASTWVLDRAASIRTSSRFLVV